MVISSVMVVLILKDPPGEPNAYVECICGILSASLTLRGEQEYEQSRTRREVIKGRRDF